MKVQNYATILYHIILNRIVFSKSRYSHCSDEDSLCLAPSEYGRLWFSVLYDVAVEQIHVTLVKVRELPGNYSELVRVRKLKKGSILSINFDFLCSYRKR